MSNINYAVYGSPEEWTHWQNATPQSGLQGTLWGQQRIGATDWSNSDFTDYPEFLFGKETIYRNYKDSGYIDINEPLDNSIAYTAMAGSDLPQNNCVILDTSHSTIERPLAYTDNTSPTPFALCWYYYGTGHIVNPAYQGSLYGFDGFPDNATVFGSQGMQRVSPYALWDSVFTNAWGMYNPNLRIAPCVRFGTKSVILEIIVIYRTTGDYPTAASNLKTYLEHTDEWLQEHKLIAAYCKPYYRTNINGTYIATNAAASTDRFGGCSALFFRPYNLQGIDIYNYTAYLSSDLNISGNLPIYGSPVTDGTWTSLNVYGYNSYETPTQTNMNSYACLFGANRGDYVKTVTSNQLSCHMELDMSDSANVEYIMRGAAAYGLFFCQAIGTLGNSGRDSGDSERWIDTEMYCGVIAPDGMTYGDYTQGEGNKDNQVYGWTDSTQTPFDPANIPDTDNTKYDYETHYPTWNLVPSTCNMYVVSQSAIEKLSDIIATAIAGRPDPDQISTVDYALNNGLTNNPIDTIISVRAYAAKQLPYSTLIPAEAIKCGAWENNSVQGHRLSRTSDSIDFHFRRSTQNGLVAKYGNSFLDYASYTRAELIIPYCGTVALQAADFMNHDINVRIIVDYITGMCTAFVMRDLVAIATVSGSMGVDIPVTGLQNATLAAQRVNAVLQRDNANLNTAGAAVGAVASTIGFAASLATGNVVGALGSGTGLLSSINRFSQSDNQLQKADYDIQHMQAPVKSIQSATPNISFRYEHTCRLIIYRPVLSSDYVPEIYGHTVGFACLINGKVKQFSGLTVGTIDTAGIVATDTEKAMIQKAFASGVYL